MEVASDLLYELLRSDGRNPHTLLARLGMAELQTLRNDRKRLSSSVRRDVSRLNTQATTTRACREAAAQVMLPFGTDHVALSDGRDASRSKCVDRSSRLRAAIMLDTGARKAVRSANSFICTSKGAIDRRFIAFPG